MYLHVYRHVTRVKSVETEHHGSPMLQTSVDQILMLTLMLMQQPLVDLYQTDVKKRQNI